MLHGRRVPFLRSGGTRVALVAALSFGLVIGAMSAPAAGLDTPTPTPSASATETPTPTATPEQAPAPAPTAEPQPEPESEYSQWETARPEDTPADPTAGNIDGWVPEARTDADGMRTGATLVGFNPGNIISDAVFFNTGSMTESQIQAFLNGKVASCQSGYVCLKDFRQTTASRSASLLCGGGYAGAANESAARIIFKVAQACGINPQVILVTLQKEQGLVTHTWPSEWRYRIAMGQGCPDTAACDTAYYGFQNQVYGAAAQFKRYANPPGTSNYFNWYAPGNTWNVRFHPNAACGSSPVYIANQATANLYYYTPYQPNRAALAAGYAAANDACSSYGNRNFYNYFTDWFGSTQTPVGACNAPASSSVTAASGLYVTSSAGSVNARKAPRTECEEGVRTLAADTLLVRTGVSGDWTRVSVDGAIAWVRSDLLVPLSSTPAPTLSLDDTRHIFALTSTGNVVAYPFSKVGRWGSSVTLVEGTPLTQLVATGDMDRDGHRDLVGVDSQGRVLLYRGDGTGFGAPSVMPVDWSSARLITGAGDFDGDSNPDVFIATKSGGLQLWRGDGRGSFKAPVVIGNGWGGITNITGGTDLSGDRIPDLLARTSAGVLMLYRGDGRGSWAGSARIGQGWASVTGLVTPGDFTGDGKPDVLTRDSAGALQLYRGTGAAIAHMAQIGVSWQGMKSIVSAGMQVDAPAPRASGPGAGDLNDDGHPDVVALSGTTLRIYRGNGAGSWSGSGVLDAAWPAGARVVPLGDFTRDGVRDLGRISSDGTFSLLAGTDGSSFAASVGIGNGWGGLSHVFGAIDFDGDGKMDVIARNSTGSLLLYRGDGNGGWLGSSVIGNGWGGFNQILNVGDFDGDGHADLLARRADGTLWLYPTTGSGAFKAPKQIGVGWSGFTALVGAGEFAGKGVPTVLARTSAGALLLYRGNGKGGWAGSSQIGTGWSGFSQIF